VPFKQLSSVINTGHKYFLNLIFLNAGRVEKHDLADWGWWYCIDAQLPWVN